MNVSPLAALLPDGKRLHLQHGPIDLVIEAWGAADEVASAYRQAIARFDDILPRLVDELTLLRQDAGAVAQFVAGPVARRMVAACAPFAGRIFLTPMAAVAGAVADEMLAALVANRTLEKAYVNDGGDIALHLSPGATLATGVVTDVSDPAIDAVASIAHAQPIRGIATSGAGGRSFSLGIADAVTILARDAAGADAAATAVANAVDLDHPAIRRARACDLSPDSDLGDRLVTVEVGVIDAAGIDAALDAGAAEADRLWRAGLIEGAVLVLRRRFRVVGDALRRLRPTS